MKSRINICSLDFDGCIFNKNYHHFIGANRLIRANRDFIDNLSKQILHEQYDEVIFMIGSNRQSLEIDFLNSKRGTDSCYSALHQLCDEFKRLVSPIQCRVDHYLLADTYGKTPNGLHFEKALNNDDDDFKYVRWLFDDSKLTILYAQIHKAASENQDAEIIFDFYDDRYLKRDILKKLADFFATHPDLIPHHVRLRLHCYAGEEVKSIATIQGTGLIDTCYHEHIHLMIHSAGLSFHGNLADCNDVLRELAKENRLNKFKEDRLVKLQNSQHHHSYASYASPHANAYYKKPKGSSTKQFNMIYAFGNTRKAYDLGELKRTNCNVDPTKDGLFPIQRHAAQGNQEAIEFFKEGGNVLPSTSINSVSGTIYERPLAERKVGPYGLFQMDRGRYFNVNFVGSTDINPRVYQLFRSVYVLIHHGQPWSKHVIGDWGKITLHPFVNGQNDGTTFSHSPDVTLIVPLHAEELKNFYKNSMTENALSPTLLQTYCVCFDDHMTNLEIENAANQLGVKVFKINPDHLFLMPNNGRCGYDDRERYLKSIGDSVRDTLSQICQNLQNKMEPVQQTCRMTV